MEKNMKSETETSFLGVCVGGGGGGGRGYLGLYELLSISGLPRNH